MGYSTIQIRYLDNPKNESDDLLTGNLKIIRNLQSNISCQEY